MVYGNSGRSSVVMEDYLAHSEPSRIIPSYASLDEMMYYVVEATEQDFNDLMMETGIRELQHFEETHTEYQYVNEASKSFFDKVEENFRKMWKRVQEMIEKAIESIQKKADNFRKTILNKLKKTVIADKAKYLKDDMDFGMSWTFVPFGKSTFVDYAKSVVKTVTNAEADIKKAYNDAVAKANKDSSQSGGGDLEDKIAAIIKKHTGNLTALNNNVDSSTSSGLRDKIVGDMRGQKKSYKGSDIKKNFDAMFEEVVNYPITKRTLKATYNDIKKSYNETIHNIKKDNDGKMFEANLYTKTISGYKKLKQVLTVMEQATISVLNEQYNFNKSVVLKVATTKVNKNKAVGESTTYDNIESLFEW